MPRGAKGSGKSTNAVGITKGKATTVSTVEKETATTMKAPRKPYPTIEERIALSEAAITKLLALYESRGNLIEKTKVTLEERKEALARVTADLEKAKAKHAKLLVRKNDKSEIAAPKLSPEARKAARIAAMATAREAKKAKKAKLAQLMDKLEQTGLTLDEAFEKLEK